MKRWLLAAALVCAGCSTILGFNDGTLISSAGPPCQAEAGCSDAGVDDNARDIATFSGAPSGLVIFESNAYFAYGTSVWGCSTFQPCPVPARIFTDGAEVGPLALHGNALAWSNPIEGKLRLCGANRLGACTMPTTYDEPGVRAIASDGGLNLYWLRSGVTPGTTELRGLSYMAYAEPITLAIIPHIGSTAALALSGPELFFVMIGGAAYSVVVPNGMPASAAIVTPLPGDSSTPVADGILATASRVIWPRGKSSGLWQCPVRSSNPIPCDESTAVPFAGMSDDITALTLYAETIVWARQSAQGINIFACAPHELDFSVQACKPFPIANNVSGQVSALATELVITSAHQNYNNVYFIAADALGLQHLAGPRNP